MVTLPKPWCRFYGLQAGDKVVMVTNGDVCITPKRRKRLKPKTGRR